jgi:hypothetical protein
MTGDVTDSTLEGKLGGGLAGGAGVTTFAMSVPTLGLEFHAPLRFSFRPRITRHHPGLGHSSQLFRLLEHGLKTAG